MSARSRTSLPAALLVIAGPLSCGTSCLTTTAAIAGIAGGRPEKIGLYPVR